VGGQGFSKGGGEIIAKFPNARLIESLHQLDQFAARFADRLADRLEPQDQGDG
jgi:hypothetical protein